MTNVNGNLITAAEAGKRWCPFSRLMGPASLSGVNRDNKGNLLAGSNCQSSKCMAWRWDFSTKEEVGSCGLAGGVGSAVPVEAKVR